VATAVAMKHDYADQMVVNLSQQQAQCELHLYRMVDTKYVD
jgi:hypothetical protein